MALADPPLRVVAGRGVWLELDDGRELIDGISSWWVTLHGHGEPTIAAAIAAQASRLEQVIFANFRHPTAERLAERLSALTGLPRLFFSDNGSTAVEVALKIAWQWWRNQGAPRSRFIAFEGAYHGDTMGAMALGERSLFTAPFDSLLFEVARAPWPATWWDDAAVERKEVEALDQLERLLETPTAAVILEPLLQGASGMRQVRPGFLREVERRVRQAGALLIADEVLMGFGRGGALFASALAGLTPDLMALSKGLTGGFLPMGVTLASERLHAGFIGTDPSLTLYHGHSFTANPLGCAAALASLDLLLARPDRHEGFAARHQPLLAELARRPGVRRPRLQGTIAAFDLIPPQRAAPEGYLNPIGRQLQRRLLREGVFLRPLGNVVYLLPPLCISDAELEQCYEALATALGEL
ncbi:MAG: adenosylmethionine--8-amino-7-oxononanoate transaminase [Cyanobacteria bacterium K_Offshore_surface_m2_239]|nr:adenosylmethionine--8-amino-7-oxononanoate transaminase [Cyanobacteria bacterium K_Offshore_surface_m2_239]